MIELVDYVDCDTGTRVSETSTESVVAISKRGGGLEVLQIDDITAMKWESPKLTLLVVESVLMDFKEADAQQAFIKLQKLGMPIDESLGKVRW